MSDKVWIRPTRAGYTAARRWQFWLVALAAIVCGALLSEAAGACPFAGAQSRGKVFEKTHDPRPRPVDLVELKAKDKVVKFGEAFESSQDWLNGATFRVKNKSGKEVVYLELDLSFPETAYTGNVMSFPIKLGRRPGSQIPAARDPLSAKPGDEIVLQVGEDKYKELVRFLETRQPVSELSKVKAEVNFVVFSDGTAWAPGGYLRQDPDNPDRYVRLDETPAGR